MLGEILERYKLNDIIIGIVKSTRDYDVIYVRDNKLGYFIRRADLSAAYAFVAGYMYNRVKLMELTSNS